MSAPIADRHYHQLTTCTHDEGITALTVAAAIEHRDQVLLIGTTTGDFEASWELPSAAVLPGQTLLNALELLLDCTGYGLQQVTRYLGHHDDERAGGHTVRTFGFTTAVEDPMALCCQASLSHLWAALDDELPAGLTPATQELLNPASRGPGLLAGIQPLILPDAIRPFPLAEALLATAGTYPLQAAIRLLIGHVVFLRHSEFTSRFVDHGTPAPDGAKLAAINWPDVITALNDGTFGCSSSEGSILRIAACLADGTPVNLSSALTGLDDRNMALVSDAIMHASGRG
jgi:hypothetical protein